MSLLHGEVIKRPRGGILLAKRGKALFFGVLVRSGEIVGVPMAKKFDSAYLEVTAVDANARQVRVSFANGDQIEMPTSELVPSRLRTTIDWANAQPSNLSTGISIPADPVAIEIPSTRLRRLSDRSFADHLARLAERQARLIGSRLKSLRQRRGLTQKAVARLAHLEPANLSRIESGRFDVSSTTLWKILAAMDCSIADLAGTASTHEQDDGDAMVARA